MWDRKCSLPTGPVVLLVAMSLEQPLQVLRTAGSLSCSFWGPASSWERQESPHLGMGSHILLSVCLCVSQSHTAWVYALHWFLLAVYYVPSMGHIISNKVDRSPCSSGVYFLLVGDRQWNIVLEGEAYWEEKKVGKGVGLSRDSGPSVPCVCRWLPWHVVSAWDFWAKWLECSLPREAFPGLICKEEPRGTQEDRPTGGQLWHACGEGEMGHAAVPLATCRDWSGRPHSCQQMPDSLGSQKVIYFPSNVHLGYL